MAASVAIHAALFLWPGAHDRAATAGREYIVEITSAAPRSTAQAQKSHVRKRQPLPTAKKSSSAIRKESEEMAKPLHQIEPEEVAQNSQSAVEQGRESIIRNHLERFKYYPASARRRGIIGEVEVAFQLDARGRAGMLKILNASGYRILDDAAMETVRRAQPFPAEGGAFQFRLHFGAS